MPFLFEAKSKFVQNKDFNKQTFLDFLRTDVTEKNINDFDKQGLSVAGMIVELIPEK